MVALSADRGIVIRVAYREEWAEVLSFYRQSGYLGRPAPVDAVVVAFHAGQIVGAARVCWESGFAVLRDVRVKPEWQRRGIGSSMVRMAMEIARKKRERLFVIPYRHLVAFYARAGFRLVSPAHAPSRVRRRWESYRARGYDVVVMGRVFDGGGH